MHTLFDRYKIFQKPLASRHNKVNIEKAYVRFDAEPKKLSPKLKNEIKILAEKILFAKDAGASIILNFGAHAIKNGLGPLLQEFLKHGWLTHLATNGAGIIHDWEFAYQAESSESVYENLPKGEFGTWQETGFAINLGIIIGVWEGYGYGAAIGKMLSEQGLHIPSEADLLATISANNNLEQVAIAADLLDIIRRFELAPGWRAMPAPYAKYSLQAAAFQLTLPSTAHPMFGHDIIYTHALNHGASIGRAAERDFLSYTASVNNLHKGVLLSVGSAIMSPMLFEKSFTMVQNVKKQKKENLNDYSVAIVDLASEASWDWQGKLAPASYQFLCADNRDFFLELFHQLQTLTKQLTHN